MVFLSIMTAWLLGTSPMLNTEATVCHPSSLVSERLEVQKGQLPDQTCSMSLRPVSTAHLIYREYIANDTGLFMIFNSFGAGDPAHFTGAREFYFFPRLRPVDFSLDPRSQDVEVHFSNGDDFEFDAHTAQLKSLGQGRVVVDSNISGLNQGGVEIKTYRGLWLDVGYAVGHSPAQDPDREVTFHLLNGKTCQVFAQEVFSISDTDAELRFTDAQLEDFLSDRCQP